jgi:hypothetical protein
MEPEAPYTPPEQDLDLRPRLKVKRLNRLAVLLVALVAILVLWGAYSAGRCTFQRNSARACPPTAKEACAANSPSTRRAGSPSSPTRCGRNRRSP